MARQPEASPTYTPATPINMPTSCSLPPSQGQGASSIPHTQAPTVGDRVSQPHPNHVHPDRTPQASLKPWPNSTPSPSTNAPELGSAALLCNSSIWLCHVQEIQAMKETLQEMKSGHRPPTLFLIMFTAPRQCSQPLTHLLSLVNLRAKGTLRATWWHFALRLSSLEARMTYWLGYSLGA